MSANTDSFSAIPQAIKDRPRWVLWRTAVRDGKPTKVPIDPATGGNAAVNRPITWTSYEAAVNALQSGIGRAAGIGFVFNGDGLSGVDLDKCRDPETGVIDEWAQEIVHSLNSYSEVSPSGTGVHVIASGKITASGNRKRRVEMYSTGRFFTMTGLHLDGTPATVEERTEALVAVHAKHVAASESRTASDPAQSDIRDDRPRDSAPHDILVEAATRYAAKVPGAAKGERHRAAFSLSGHLFAFEIDRTREKLSETEILSILHAWNLRNHPALESHDLQKALRSAMKSGTPRNPHVVSERGSYRYESDGRARKQRRPPAHLEAVTSFPVNALPQPLRAFVAEVSTALPCDPAYVALPILTACASAIGNARVVQLKRGWTEPSVLWTAVVGDSGTVKSPAMEITLRPIFDVQAHALHEHADNVRDFEEARLEYEKSLVDWKRSKGGDAPEKPEPPIAARFITSDVTVESLAILLRDALRGILVARDEVGGWLKSFDAYRQGRGGDAQKYLEMHRAGKLIVDRKSGPEKDRTLFVPRAAVSICGGIQPGALRRALTPEFFEIGLAARLLLAMPKRKVKRWTDAEITPDQELALASLLTRLRGLPMKVDADGSPEPTPIGLTEEARDRFIAFYNAHNEEQINLDGDLSAAWAKIEGYAARFALVFHLVRAAAGDPTIQDPNFIDADSMDKAIVLARWFANEARRIYAALAETDEDRKHRELIELIQRRGGTITARELMRATRRYANSDDAEAALSYLVEVGLAALKTDDHGGERGRPVDRYELVDPASVDTNGENAGEFPNVSVSAAQAEPRLADSDRTPPKSGSTTESADTNTENVGEVGIVSTPPQPPPSEHASGSATSAPKMPIDVDTFANSAPNPNNASAPQSPVTPVDPDRPNPPEGEEPALATRVTADTDTMPNSPENSRNVSTRGVSEPGGDEAWEEVP